MAAIIPFGSGSSALAPESSPLETRDWTTEVNRMNIPLMIAIVVLPSCLTMILLEWCHLRHSEHLKWIRSRYLLIVNVRLWVLMIKAAVPLPIVIVQAIMTPDDLSIYRPIVSSSRRISDIGYPACTLCSPDFHTAGPEQSIVRGGPLWNCLFDSNQGSKVNRPQDETEDTTTDERPKTDQPTEIGYPQTGRRP